MKRHRFNGIRYAITTREVVEALTLWLDEAHGVALRENSVFSLAKAASPQDLALGDPAQPLVPIRSTFPDHTDDSGEDQE